MANQNREEDVHRSQSAPDLASQYLQFSPEPEQPTEINDAAEIEKDVIDDDPPLFCAKVLRHRFDPDGKVKYLIRWHPTWEDPEKVSNLSPVLAEYDLYHNPPLGSEPLLKRSYSMSEEQEEDEDDDDDEDDHDYEISHPPSHFRRKIGLRRSKSNILFAKKRSLWDDQADVASPAMTTESGDTEEIDLENEAW